MALIILYYIALFIFGAALGSFISVVIYRLHKGEKGIFTGRSHCPQCKKELEVPDLIPILSYLTLRGQCRYCSKEISYMYPMLEAVTGAVFALLFAKFQFADSALNFSGMHFGLYALYGFYAFVLIFTFFYDLKYMEIADQILLPGIIIALIATLGFPLTPHIIDALIGAAIGTAFFAVQYGLSGGKWVGLGDLRVGAFMGAILGWKFLLVALFISYITGSIASIFIIAQKKKLLGVKVPLAPFLVIGTFATIFFGEEILKWYLGGLGF